MIISPWRARQVADPSAPATGRSANYASSPQGADKQLGVRRSAFRRHFNGRFFSDSGKTGLLSPEHKYGRGTTFYLRESSLFLYPPVRFDGR